MQSKFLHLCEIAVVSPAEKQGFFSFHAGRVARAGRSGTAYSLIGPDELSYVMDLHLFLGRPMKYVAPGKHKQGMATTQTGK